MLDLKKNYLNDILKDKAMIWRQGEEERLAMASGSIKLKVTSEHTMDRFGIYEIILKPHAVGANLHYHRYMDEVFLIIEGTLTVMHGTHTDEVTSGGTVFVPRFTPHGFRNESDKEVKLMLIFNPAMQREGFFRGLKEILAEDPIDKTKFLQLYDKYDSIPVDKQSILPISRQTATSNEPANS
jgi:mannose-6-phosphate isomerase-like protein (cupin superfamily)